VKLGALIEGLRVVKEGIGANDRIVVNGVVHIRPGVQVTPEEGNMAELAGGIRRQVSVDPVGGNLKQSDAGKPTPESHTPTPPPPTPQHQPGTGEK
jgi:hypothetical protein